jgi:hypothetical protein
MRTISGVGGGHVTDGVGIDFLMSWASWFQSSLESWMMHRLSMQRYFLKKKSASQSDGVAKGLREKSVWNI